MTRVIATPRGNLKQFVNGQYAKVFNAFIKENIFSYSPGTTSGAIGPGEMALSMMGNPAEKGKKGDLKIGKREIEVKASAKTGGRLNSKKFAKATTGWEAWSEGINAIMKTADESRTIGQGQKDGTVKQIPIQDWSGKEYNYNKAKKTSKEGSRYNWSPTGFRKLNEETSHPFYISDSGYGNDSSSSISISGDGSATSGIRGDETFTITFNKEQTEISSRCD